MVIGWGPVYTHPGGSTKFKPKKIPGCSAGGDFLLRLRIRLLELLLQSTQRQLVLLGLCPLPAEPL
jgi:hypothetical protein